MLVLSTVLSAIRARLSKRMESDRAAATGVVPVIILIAGFSIVCIVLIVFMDHAIENQAVDAGRCVEGTSGYSSNTSATTCAGNVAEEGNNSFAEDEAYTSRY